jgi:hypothetical protein
MPPLSRLLAAFLLAGALLGACGDGDDEGDAPNGTDSTGTSTSAAGETTASSPSATAPSEQAVGNTATPTPTATATPAPTGHPLVAALADLDAVTGGDCDRPENRSRLCATLESDDNTVANGMAVISVDNRSGGGFNALYGRTLNGEWKAWEHTQNPFLLLGLPGNVRVCADGDGLNVRELPAQTGNVVQLLPDNTIARADRFVLETPRSGETRGFGWYHLVSPIEGWAHSEFLANAAHGDCALRDAQAGG